MEGIETRSEETEVQIRSDYKVSEEKADDFATALERAFKIQEGASQSVSSMRRKLKSRGFTQEVIEKVIEELKALGYLNDYSLGKSRARRRLERGYGIGIIRGELNSKGIEKETSQGITGEITEDEQIQSALKAFSSYIRKNGEHPMHFKTRRRAGLVRRGFGFEIIKKAEEFLKDEE